MADESIIDILEKKLKKKAREEHEIIYDSSSQTLEPLYFWILDFMNKRFNGNVEKLVDNFASSPGSGHFSELGTKKTAMQEQVMKTLGGINQVIRTIVNLVYDLKDFEIRLKLYEDLNSKDKMQKEAALLALKQVWMDNVDIKRGQGSINGLTAGNLQFVTLRDAFLAVNSLEGVDKLDINDRVKRILKPRIAEFLEWKKLSEQELKKRFEIEKKYLKSQVNTLQLYARWMKPYLKAATELEMRGGEKSPELVAAFNTILLELTLMGTIKVDVQEALRLKKLPVGISMPRRDYYSIVIVDFHFRGIPGKAGQHYTFGGRATIKFKGYDLNDDEMDLFKKEMQKSEVNEVMGLIKGITTESIDELKGDIDYFLDKKSDKEKEEEKKNSSDTNPFSALFSIFKKDKKKKEKEEIKDLKQIKKDSYSESLVRELAKDEAKLACFNVFDIFKKSHGMPAHNDPYEEY